MIDSNALIRLARETLKLAAQDVAPEFQQACLRRAVSTAYYALFHEIVDRASALAFPGENESLRFSQYVVTRNIAHKDVKQACEEFVKSGFGSLKMRMEATLGGASEADVEEEKSVQNARYLCKVFSVAYLRREQADYDRRMKTLDQATTAAMIDDCDDALRRLQAALGTPAPSDVAIRIYATLFTAMLYPPRRGL